MKTTCSPDKVIHLLESSELETNDFVYTEPEVKAISRAEVTLSDCVMSNCRVEIALDTGLSDSAVSSRSGRSYFPTLKYNLNTCNGLNRSFKCINLKTWCSKGHSY